VHDVRPPSKHVCVRELAADLGDSDRQNRHGNEISKGSNVGAIQPLERAPTGNRQRAQTSRAPAF
jgi:hypothetical protein